ncbi:MAG: hypothetical protein GY788_12380 [bacterium]|nr:hypothetical protein [bacterium]
MRIIGLDLGRLTGFASGTPGEKPKSFTVILSRPREGLAVQCGNLIAFLDRELRDKPTALAKEAPFSLAAFSDKAVAEAVVKSAYGLHAIVEGMCQRYGVTCHSVADSTVRKHFTGRGRHGDRKATKQAVITRCIQLGYAPRDCKDEDRCDALAVFDWASATIAKKPGAFQLFEGRAA